MFRRERGARTRRDPGVESTPASLPQVPEQALARVRPLLRFRTYAASARRDPPVQPLVQVFEESNRPLEPELLALAALGRLPKPAPLERIVQ